MLKQTQLSSSEQEFFNWLNDTMPYLLTLFSESQAAYIPEAVDSFLSTASEGECCMCRFALMVWRHDNDFQFNPADVDCLVDRELNIIANWFRNPSWP